MALANKNIHDLRSLEKEISRLLREARKLENKLDGNLNYLQEHSSSLMINTLLSSIIKTETVSGTVFNFLLQNERLQKTLGKLAEVLVDKAAVGVDTLINKISPNKD
jgi:hypothetical protein